MGGCARHRQKTYSVLDAGQRRYKESKTIQMLSTDDCGAACTGQRVTMRTCKALAMLQGGENDLIVCGRGGKS